MALAYLREESAAFAHAFTSKQAFKEWVVVTPEAADSDRESSVDLRWCNEDLYPTPKDKQTWKWKNYISFWFGLSYGNWTLGSSFIGIGLSWWESIIVIFVSQLIASVAMALNSRAAAVYHVGYPAVARSVFGMWGSFYVVGARAVLAVVWYGVQLYSGASLLEVMLRCVFGGLYTNIPNTIPQSVGITSAGMLAFFLFWLIHLCVAPFRPYQLRIFFNVKSIVILPAIFGLFIFCMVETKGNVGAVYASDITSAKVWFVIQGLNAGLGNVATLITNQPDIARWSNSKTAGMWTVVAVLPFATTLAAALGILATAAINNTWGLALWNQWDLLDAILDRYWTAGSRALVFLSAFTWTISILGTNIAANMIPFGADVTLLLPRYLTIPRGQFLVQILAFAICPWKILASATVFTTFLSGYGLFMGSVVAVMIADYWILTKGNVFIGSLYDPTKKNSYYYYNRGWNVQAYIAYICGVLPPFPGFVGSLGVSVSAPATDMGNLGWFLSFSISFVTYYCICSVWPTQAQRMVREKGLLWEEMEGHDVVLDAANDRDSDLVVDEESQTMGAKRD